MGDNKVTALIDAYEAISEQLINLEDQLQTLDETNELGSFVQRMRSLGEIVYVNLNRAEQGLPTNYRG